MFSIFLRIWSNISPYGRNTRHTTHLDGYPEKVKIIRNHHPLQGKYLEVLGWHRRNKILYLTLVLPDGSRSFIPAAWTNLDKIGTHEFTIPNRKFQTDLIATASSFLHARKIVDSLLGKILSSQQKSQTASRKENHHAKTAAPLAHAGRALTNSGYLASPRSRTTKAGNNSCGPPDLQNSSPRKNKTDQGGEQ